MIETIKTIWEGLDFSVLTGILLSVVPALLCIVFHELCHGFVAYKLGDNTAKNAGRLSLNPFKHLDIVGLIAMMFLHVGWAKPVPVNMNSFKNPKRGMAITALAGPLSNILLAAVVLLLYGFLYIPLLKLGDFGYVIIETLGRTAVFSCSLAVFNIFPIPPMDGSKVLFALLPDKAYYKLMEYERYGMLIVLLLVITGVIDPVLTYLVNALVGLLSPLMNLGFSFYI
ncbi:MAG: site-2 protease family protein [Oscillospiraceae bacterium]|nr:site-2 protease family protein [Oscillospiraceae bacterium]